MPPTTPNTLVFNCTTGQAIVRALTAAEVSALTASQVVSPAQQAADAQRANDIALLHNAAAGTVPVDGAFAAALIRVLGL